MNRFFRTAYAATFVYLFLALIAGLFTGVSVPFLSFLCLYFGLLLALLPCGMPKLQGREAVFVLLGVPLALLGFLPIHLYGGTILSYVAHGLGVLGTALFCHTLKHRTTHGDFAAKFRFSAVLILVLIAYLYLSLLVGVTAEDILPVRKAYVSQALDHVVPIAIMLLVTGVLLLRGLRGLEGVTDERAFNRRQLRDVLLYGSMVGVIFVLDPFPYLYRGVAWCIGRVARRFVWAFNGLLDLLANKEPRFDPPTPEATSDPSDYILPPPSHQVTEREPEQYKINEVGETTLYRTILYIFLLALAAVLLVILIVEVRKLIQKLRDRGASRSRGYPNEIRESLDEGPADRRAAKPKKYSGDPRMRMRYLYGEFLHLLSRVPIHIAPGDTCGQIHERARRVMHVNGRDLEAFQALYELARYRESEAPTSQDAARMKTLFARLKKGRS